MMDNINIKTNLEQWIDEKMQKEIDTKFKNLSDLIMVNFTNIFNKNYIELFNVLDEWLKDTHLSNIRIEKVKELVNKLDEEEVRDVIAKDLGKNIDDITSNDCIKFVKKYALSFPMNERMNLVLSGSKNLFCLIDIEKIFQTYCVGDILFDINKIEQELIEKLNPIFTKIKYLKYFEEIEKSNMENQKIFPLNKYQIKDYNVKDMLIDKMLKESIFIMNQIKSNKIGLENKDKSKKTLSIIKKEVSNINKRLNDYLDKIDSINTNMSSYSCIIIYTELLCKVINQNINEYSASDLRKFLEELSKIKDLYKKETNFEANKMNLFIEAFKKIREVEDIDDYFRLFDKFTYEGKDGNYWMANYIHDKLLLEEYKNKDILSSINYEIIEDKELNNKIIKIFMPSVLCMNYFKNLKKEFEIISDDNKYSIELKYDKQFIMTEIELNVPFDFNKDIIIILKEINNVGCIEAESIEMDLSIQNLFHKWELELVLVSNEKVKEKKEKRKI